MGLMVNARGLKREEERRDWAAMSRILFALGMVPLLLLASCQTSTPELEARNQQILAEPPGDYWIGRRVAVQRTRFWGYVRRPRQLWDRAELVVFNEREKLAPDRLPETAVGGGRRFQFDNNHEYRLRGYFSGRRVYDPNSNKILPEFILQDYAPLSADPGFLFHPRERRDAYGIPVPPR
jgi:hypothetical protein